MPTASAQACGAELGARGRQRPPPTACRSTAAPAGRPRRRRPGTPCRAAGPPTDERGDVVQPAGLRRSPRCRASHQAAGSTSVPSGCWRPPLADQLPRSRRPARRPCRTGSTSRRRRPGRHPRAPSRCSTASWFEPHEAVAALAGLVGVEVLERRAVGQQVGVASRRRPASASPARRRPRRGQRLHDLRVGAERRRALLQQQVGAHVRGRGRPHAVDVLGAQRLVVEVPRAVVAGPPLGARSPAGRP